MRDELVESSIIKIQNYIRKVCLPRRMEKKLLEGKGKKGKKKIKRGTTTGKTTTVRSVVDQVQKKAMQF